MDRIAAAARIAKTRIARMIGGEATPAVSRDPGSSVVVRGSTSRTTTRSSRAGARAGMSAMIGPGRSA